VRTEDEPTLAQSIELMLRSENFEVATAALGEEGLSLAGTQEHDIIVLDLNLPDMSGYDVLRSQRIQRVNTPVLILSGLAATDDKVKGLGLERTTT
jgi:two-component system, cell cycle response regulator CtrA